MTLTLVSNTNAGPGRKYKLPWYVYKSIIDKIEDRRFWWTKGLGSGGTYGLAIWHYLKCLQNHRSPFSWSIAPTFQQVSDTLLPTFAEVLQVEFGLVEGEDYKIVASGRPRLYFPKRRQLIHFRSANRPDRMVGPSVSHISGTEVGLWPREAYEKSSARLRCPKAVSNQYLGEGTPEGFNWWEKEANFAEGVDDEKNARRIILHTADNKFLKPGYVDQLRRTYEYDPAKLESYLYGNFVSFTKGSAYWEFAESRNVVLDVEASPYLPVLLCFDFNKFPIAWVAMQRQPHSRNGVDYHRFVALAESSGKSRGMQDACAEFISAMPTGKFGNTRIEVYGDPSGYAGSHLSLNSGYDQIYSYLKPRYRSVSIMAERSAPEIQARLERTNALLAYEQYVVAAWCRNLIKSHKLTNLKNGLWKFEKPQGDDWTHWSDATGYPLYQITKGDDLENPNRKKVYGINQQI